MVSQSVLGPLGIHVVPCNEDGRLVVQGIEPGGRVDRDGRLAVGDEIVEINGFPLTNVLFNKAQEIFKEALLHKDLVLQVSGKFLWEKRVPNEDCPRGFYTKVESCSVATTLERYLPEM